MGSTGTGPIESGSPDSNLGYRQLLKLPSGASYEYIGGLRYRMGSEGTHRVESFAGSESCIRIFRSADSDIAEAILFVPNKGNAPMQDVQSGLLERLGIIEHGESQAFLGVQITDKAAKNCAIYRTDADRVTGTSPFFERSLHELISQYSRALEGRYAQEGENLGRVTGLFTGGVGSVLVNALIIAYKANPTLESVAGAVISSALTMVLASEFCKRGFAKSAREDAHETLRKRLIRGHENETHTHHLANFIRSNYQNTDVLKTREQALDSAFSSLARTPAGEGLMIQLKGLSYDQVIARCEMLLGVKPAQYLPSREVAAIVVPDPVMSQIESKVKLAFASPASKCPHCHDDLRAGDSCITGLMNGAHSQAHAECSGEMIKSEGDWRPISGEYAYESLVDHTTNQPDKKKEERRVKE